ncbi:hypothetical protein TYRP_016076 [Tyrophagus putrescentiae]|nr:hypothetical protein TYRP_016076 [Tyrophagus putrescentiae]
MPKIPLPPKMSKKSSSCSSSPVSKCTEYPLAQMSNEERMKVCVKQLFADRPYKGWFVYRNPPSKQQKSNSVQVKAPPQLNPIVSSVGSQFFSRPENGNAEDKSPLKMDVNSKSASKSQGQRLAKPSFGKGQSAKSASSPASKNQK